MTLLSWMIAALIAQDHSPPLAPTDLTVIPAGHSRATLRWKAPAEDHASPDVNNHVAGPSPSPSPSPSASPCASYDIRWSTAPIAAAPAWTSATPVEGEPVPAAPGTVQQFTVKSLPSDQVCYFAIRGIDEAGNLGVMGTISGRTAVDTIAPEPIGDFRLDFTEGRTLNFAWTAPGDDDGRSVAGYDLRYSAAAIAGIAWHSATPAGDEPVAQDRGKVERMALGGLATGTYRFAIAALDGTGNAGAPTQGILAWVPGDPPDETPEASPCALSTSFSAAPVILLIATLTLGRRS